MLPKVSQGVTTVVVGNCGISLSPSPVARGGEPIPPLNLLGGREVFGFPRFADYRRRVEEQPGPVNVAALVGHMTLRARALRSEEHTSELQSLMRSSYAVFCLKKKNKHIYSRKTERHYA